MMCADDRCVLCKSGETEDVEHFLVKCEEFGGGGGRHPPSGTPSGYI